MTYFKDKVTLITGGTSGIGQALGEALTREGAVVYLAGRRLERAQETAQKLQAEGLKAFSCRLDVTDQSAVQGSIKQISRDHGRLDLMINNAGIVIGGDARDISLDQWQKVLDVNLMGVLYGTHEAYNIMATQGFGQIVNIASVAGLVEYPINSPYATSKFAVVGLSKTLRIEGEKLGIKVNVVCPGYIRTEIFESLTIVKADTTKVVEAIPYKMMKVQAAAQRILQGIKKNEAVMVFPGHAKMLVFLSRNLPSIFAKMGRKIMADFRRLRNIE